MNETGHYGALVGCENVQWIKYCFEVNKTENANTMRWLSDYVGEIGTIKFSHLLTGTPLCALMDSFSCVRKLKVLSCQIRKEPTRRRDDFNPCMVSFLSTIRARLNWVAKIGYTNDRCAFTVTSNQCTHSYRLLHDHRLFSFNRCGTRHGSKYTLLVYAGFVLLMDQVRMRASIAANYIFSLSCFMDH